MLERVLMLDEAGKPVQLGLCFGDKVRIDGGAVIGTVVGFCLYPHGVEIRVSWWNSGSLLQEWIAAWRVSKEP